MTDIVHIALAIGCSLVDFVGGPDRTISLLNRLRTRVGGDVRLELHVSNECLIRAVEHGDDEQVRELSRRHLSTLASLDLESLERTDPKAVGLAIASVKGLGASGERLDKLGWPKEALVVLEGLVAQYHLDDLSLPKRVERLEGTDVEQVATRACRAWRQGLNWEAG